MYALPSFCGKIPPAIRDRRVFGGTISSCQLVHAKSLGNGNIS